MSDTNTNEQKTVDYSGLEHYDDKIKTYIQDKIDSSGTGGITVDDALSSASKNPVQNKVVKAELDKKANKDIYSDNSINLGRTPDKTAGTNSIAMGTDVEASGIHAHAEGSSTSAIGNHAFAGGIDTEVEGNVSLAYGEGLKTSKYYSAAFGIYNFFDEDTLFSIGNGDSDTERSNAFEITKTGGKLHDKDIATVDMIPESAIITEETIAGWGFTKNTGTYSKPTGGIPKTDLASDVQSSLEKADNALPLSGGTMTGSIILPKNDDIGIIPDANNYGQIGSSSKKFYRMYATTFYGDLFYGDLSGSATKLTPLSYQTITISTSDWAANSSGGYTCTKTLSSAMAYEHFNFEVVLSSEQASAKLQIESWNYVMADGMITQTTSNGSTTAFTFYAFTTKPTVALTIAIQGVSGS